MIDQSIPSPYEIIAFEEVDRNYASIFTTYHDYDTITVPAFTRERVSVYLKFREIATNLGHNKKASCHTRSTMTLEGTPCLISMSSAR